MLLNVEKVDLILGSGIVRQIICNINGYDAKTFEDMRSPEKFDKMRNNFYKLIQKK